MSTPNIPPRPQRAQQSAGPAANDTPLVPPRPNRKTDPSPDREAYTRSPLNALPGSVTNKLPVPRAESDLPRRPPSVSLPSIGQEGSEYSSYDDLPEQAKVASGAGNEVEAAGQTKSVSADLKLHQPVASVPQSTATRQIQTVTRTDSASAAAAGIGRHTPAEAPSTGDATISHSQQHHDSHHGSPLVRTTSNTAGGRRPSSVEPHPLRARASFNRSSNSLVPGHERPSRPPSVHGDHDRIPAIGKQIPLYPNAGDVQAPSPVPGSTQHAPGIGFFNDGSAAGGRPGHTRKRSTRQEFGPPDSYGLRHDQDHQGQFERAWQAKHPEEAAKEEFHHHLPRPASALTSEQLNRLVGDQGPTSSGPGSTGTPDEEDVLDATEEFYSRRSAPKGTQVGSEAGVDDHVMHVYSNPRRSSRISVGSVEHAFGAEHHADRGGYASDRDMPILAADEVIKRPGSAFMHAAINPNDPMGDYPEDSDYTIGGERRNSRPSSVHGNTLHRHTSRDEHLGEIEEYDPLFPEDDDGKPRPKKTQARRPDSAAMHHFPSRDVWEDEPDSLRYSAEVSTPDIDREREGVDPADAAPSAVFETPEAELRRREQNPDDMTSDKKTFMKPHFKAGVREQMHDRPGLPRFPSSDVWEDSPDSDLLETTVSGPQRDDSETAESPVGTAAPASLHAGNGGRPEKHSPLAQEVTPETLDGAQRQRPNVPARPVRASHPATGEDQSSAPTQKAKPAVPARPSSDKFGNALRGNAGFLSDLNNRLKLGPQGPPPRNTAQEADSEPAAAAAAAEPLADARKGRAKGPMRRKPATATTTELKSASFALSPLITVWSIDEEDELQVEESSSTAAGSAAATTSLAQAQALEG